MLINKTRKRGKANGAKERGKGKSKPPSNGKIYTAKQLAAFAYCKSVQDSKSESLKIAKHIKVWLEMHSTAKPENYTRICNKFWVAAKGMPHHSKPTAQQIMIAQYIFKSITHVTQAVPAP